MFHFPFLLIALFYQFQAVFLNLNRLIPDNLFKTLLYIFQVKGSILILTSSSFSLLITTNIAFHKYDRPTLVFPGIFIALVPTLCVGTHIGRSASSAL